MKLIIITPYDCGKILIESLQIQQQLIETAIRYNKLGIMSSHRVSFIRVLDIINREIGLRALVILLYQIVEN